MADKVGDEFEGYITGVAAFGLFIELIEHFVEGMVHVSTMADDYYRFVDGAHMLRGENTQQGLSPRRQGQGAGHPRQHGRAADRSRAWSRFSSASATASAGRGEARRRRSAEQRRHKQRPGRRERQRRKRAETVVAQSSAESAASRERSAFPQCVPSSSAPPGTSITARARSCCALTGIDPDRLKEEKARGITIDLGFAHQIIDGVSFAFVDVPGHERFVQEHARRRRRHRSRRAGGRRRRVGDAADARALRHLPAAGRAAPAWSRSPSPIWSMPTRSTLVRARRSRAGGRLVPRGRADRRRCRRETGDGLDALRVGAWSTRAARARARPPAA